MNETSTPLTLKKFHTISLADKNYKSILSTTVNTRNETNNRITSRKSNSVLASPQSFLNSTLPVIQTNLSLPKIKQTKRKQKKQGTFLQSWLDEALGAPDPFGQQKQQQQQKVESNVLKTLKKFQLDKRYLQSQNIPGQKIQKLYKSLYIYSHGVNKIFQDLIALTKQVENPQLVGNFWRAYTKLMQGCTSYQTVFQKIQKDHLINIQRLRSNIQMKAQSFLQQKNELQAKINKLEKLVEQKQTKLNNLQTEYNVLENTLNLTDEAFNDQVNLRLKFEQKINAIYTCYQQLKAKYSKIIEQMSVKNTQMIQQSNKQTQLKNKLLIQQTKVQELQFLLHAQKQKIKQRQVELGIKVQQLQDAKAYIAAHANQKDNANDIIEQHLSKIKSLRTKLIQIENVVSGQKITIKQQNHHIEKISKSLEQQKEKNNEIYVKYASSGKKIVQLQTNIHKQDLKLTQFSKTIIQKSAQISDLNRELTHTKGEKDKYIHQLNIMTKNYKDTKETMTKNNVLLQEMKAVKDKYQRINHYQIQNIKQLQNSLNKSNQQLQIKTQEFQGMKLLLDNRNKTLEQLQKKLQQQRELTKAKINALNSVITKKQTLVAQYNKKTDQLQQQLQNQKSKTRIKQQNYIILESLKTKVQVELATKVKLLKDLQTIMSKQNNRFKQLNSQLQVQLKQKANITTKLSTTEFVLKTKNEEQRVQVISLSNLLNQYKERLVEKAQYIHPMVYEQLLQVARRCERNQLLAKKYLTQNEKQMAVIQAKLDNLEKQLKQLRIKAQQFQRCYNQQKSQKDKLGENVRKTQDNLSKAKILYEKQEKLSKQLKYKLEQKTKAEAALNQKLKQKEKQVESKIIKIKQMQQIIQSLNSKRKGTTAQKSRVETREVKRKNTNNISFDKQIQTQPVQIKQQSQQQANREQPQICNQQVQTQNYQFQVHTPQLSLNNQDRSADILKSNYKQVGSAANNSKDNRNSSKLQQQPGVKKQEVPQKKVQSKQFRKALKLTYMRR